MLRPPVGVALLGFVALMAGFAFLVIGFRYAGYVVFGRGELGDGLFLWGILAIISGVLFIAAAFSLWATQPWGWLFAHYLAIFGLIEAVFVMIANNSLTDGIAVALFPLLVIWYLNDKDVKGAFGMGSTA
jgi:cytochrome c oxidase subunit IV